MSMTPGAPPALISEYSTKPGDTGSPEVQVAMLSERIIDLTEHLKIHAKDFHSRRGLLMLVGRRRGLLDYLKGKDNDRYTRLIGQPRPAPLTALPWPASGPGRRRRDLPRGAEMHGNPARPAAICSARGR